MQVAPPCEILSSCQLLFFPLLPRALFLWAVSESFRPRKELCAVNHTLTEHEKYLLVVFVILLSLLLDKLSFRVSIESGSFSRLDEGLGQGYCYIMFCYFHNAQHGAWSVIGAQ